MSTRSPKDSVIKTEDFKKIFKENLEIKNNESSAVIATLSQSLSVKTGKEAMDLLINRFHSIIIEINFFFV